MAKRAATEVRKNGVQDWYIKRDIINAIFGVATPKQLARRILGITPSADAIEKAMVKWHSHTPRSLRSIRFFDSLAKELGCNESVKGTRLIHADARAFIELLGEKQKEIANQIMVERRRGNTPIQDAAEIAGSRLANASQIRLPSIKPLETIATGFQAGKIDQRHYYLDPDTSSSWDSLIRGDSYPVFDHCKSSLSAMVHSDTWNTAISDLQPGSVVMLAGGGSAAKDKLILRSILAHTPADSELNYCILDISFYMLRDSVLSLSEFIRSVDGHERVKIDAIHEDILCLTEDHRHWFHRNGPVIFGITGVTIGNISETAFFKSLENASAEGDLLFISAETIDESPDEVTAGYLTRSYSSRELKRLLHPVVRTVLSHSRSRETVDSALDRLRVQFLPAGRRHTSDIPSAWSIIVSLDVDGRDLTLVSSARYIDKDFEAFAGRFGWEIIDQIASPNNSNYRQFVFRRNR